MTRKTLLLGIGILAVLAVAALLLFTRNRPTLQGTVFDPPWPAPEISLTDPNGQTFTLSNQRGKVVLLYFGYVNCPDECPLTMAHIKLALEQVGTSASGMQIVMVSTDPARDTPQALKDFMGHFGPSFLGLTGSTDQLQQTWQSYGVTVEDGGETHSTYLYVIDPTGKVRETFLPETEPEDIASDVKMLLNEK